MATIGLKASSFASITAALARANSVLENAETTSRNARNSLSMEVRSRENIDSMIQSSITTLQAQNGKVSSLKSMTANALDELSAKDNQCAQKTKSALNIVISPNKTLKLPNVVSIEHHNAATKIIFSKGDSNVRIASFAAILAWWSKWSKEDKNLFGIKIPVKNTYLYVDDGHIKIFKDRAQYEEFLRTKGMYFGIDSNGQQHIFNSAEKYENFLKQQGAYYLKNADGSYSLFDNEAAFKAEKWKRETKLISWNSKDYKVQEGKKIDYSQYSVVPGMENLIGRNLKQKPKMCTAYSYWMMGLMAGVPSTPKTPDGMWVYTYTDKKGNKHYGAAASSAKSNPCTEQKTSGKYADKKATIDTSKYTTEAQYYEFIVKNVSSGTPVGIRVEGHTMVCVGLKNGTTWDDIKNMSSKEINEHLLIADPADGEIQPMSVCYNSKIEIGSSLWTPDGATVIGEPKP